MAWDGRQRRAGDQRLMEMHGQMMALQERFREIAETQRELSAHLGNLQTEVHRLVSMLERWRTAVWVLASIGALLAWVETQYRAVSGYLAWLVRGGGGP